MPNTLIPNPTEWASKLDAFASAPLKDRCVVADWDRTLTRALDDEGRDHSTYSVIVNGGYLGDDFAEKSRSLFVTYRGVELSGGGPEDDGTALMHSWWAGQFDLLIAAGLSMEVINRIGADGRLLLREGVSEFLSCLAASGVPVVILSASFTRLIETLLRSRALLTPNITVIANRFRYNADGNANGFEEPILHSLNKSEVFRDRISASGVTLRRNVLVLGDSIEDLGVTGGKSEDELRIAWLHENAKARQAEFAEAADALIVNDAGLDALPPLRPTFWQRDGVSPAKDSA